MPTTKRDLQALQYLAKRLRDETMGAGEWHDAGLSAVLARLEGQQLALTVERVTRHAADPDARTPAAIERPFTPPAQTEATRVWGPHDSGLVCSVCSLTEDRCRVTWGDHQFRSIAAQKAAVKRANFDTAAIRQALRAEVEPTREPVEKPQPERTNPHAAAARARLQPQEEA